MAAPQAEANRKRLRPRIKHACHARTVFIIAISQILHVRTDGRGRQPLAHTLELI